MAALRELPELAVSETRSVGDMAGRIRMDAPDLVVADLDAERDGSAEVLELLDTTHAAAAIFLASNVERFEARVAQNPRALILDKPISDRALRHIVSEKLRPDAPFIAADYIQLACSGQHSVRITIAGLSEVGFIHIVRGTLWSASMGSLRGVEALRRLAFATGTSVCCDGGNAALPRRNLPGSSWEHQLLDAARQHDESNRGLRVPPDSAALEEVDPDALFDEGRAPTVAEDVQFERLMEQAAEALLAKDYASARRAYEEVVALRPEDRIARGNLARLRVLTEG